MFQGLFNVPDLCPKIPMILMTDIASTKYWFLVLLGIVHITWNLGLVSLTTFQSHQILQILTLFQGPIMFQGPDYYCNAIQPFLSG
jgi:hypothetical protein